MADAVAITLWVGVMLYAIFGVADFGAGFWDLVAGGTRRGERPRVLIDRALTPVWEANHVWIVYVLVWAWTGFAIAFASITSTMFIPLTLAMLGIVLRGAGFALRKVAHRLSGRRLFGFAFAVSSLLTPFFLGTILGGIASGRVPVGNGEGDAVTSWLNPTSVMVGALVVALGAMTSAAFLAVDARKHADEEMTGYFRRRAVGAGAVAGALALGGLAVLNGDAPYLFDGLTSGPGLALVIVSGLCGLAVIAMAATGRLRGIRVVAAGAVAAVVWGWAVAQYPYLLPETLTIADGAAPDITLGLLLGVFGVALLLVIPSFALLYALSQRDELEEEPLRAGPDFPGPA